MKPLGYLFALLACIALVRALRRDFLKGLALGVALAVALPDSMRISAGLFELTIQRIVVIIIAAFWLQRPRGTSALIHARFFNGLICVGIVQLISLVMSTRIESSIKDLLSYAVEICLFYVILSSSLTGARSIFLVTKYLCVAVVAGAIVATIQKYTGFNVQSLVVDMPGPEDGAMDVSAMYSSRIMLGDAMAMGVPLWIGLLSMSRTRKEQVQSWVGLVLVIAACYYSASRGPWLGAIIGAVVVACLGTSKPRKILLTAAALSLLVMIVRPGVKDTIRGLALGTFDEDTLKGKSYKYRWTLWHVAYSEITKSPVRVLFGYGGLSTEGMVLSDYFEREGASSIKHLGFTSWDNNYASDLIEFGLVGLIGRSLLYLLILGATWVSWRQANHRFKDLLAANVAACVAYLFALTNVYMFSPQVKFQFWILVATGTSIAWNRGFAFPKNSGRLTQKPHPDSEPLMEAVSAPASPV